MYNLTWHAMFTGLAMYSPTSHLSPREHWHSVDVVTGNVTLHLHQTGERAVLATTTTPTHPSVRANVDGRTTTSAFPSFSVRNSPIYILQSDSAHDAVRPSPSPQPTASTSRPAPPSATALEQRRRVTASSSIMGTRCSCNDEENNNPRKRRRVMDTMRTVTFFFPFHLSSSHL